MVKDVVLDKYNHDVYMASIFEGDTVYHEAVMFIDSVDGFRNTEKKLLYPIDEIISVRSDKLDKEYVFGKDYDLMDGKLVWLTNGECPIWKGNLTVSADQNDSYVDPTLNVGTSGNAAGWYRLYENGNRGLNLIFDAYHEAKTVYVTYKHSKTWGDLGEKGFTPIKPKNNKDKIKNFFEKLSSGKEINVLVYGDSTATGESSTGYNVNYDLLSAEPQEKGDYAIQRRDKNNGLNTPAFFELATEEIVKRKGKDNKINYYNIACGGKDAAWGNRNLKPRVDFINKHYGKTVTPDIIYIKFMANDVRTDAQYFKDSFTGMVSQFRELYKDALIVLVSGKINNEKCYIFRESKENIAKLQDVLRNVANSFENCITAEVTPVFEEILKSKDVEDYMSNNINHGNDFWARIVAQCIVESIV